MRQSVAGSGALRYAPPTSVVAQTRAVVGGIAGGDCDPRRRRRKSGLGIAVAKRPVAEEVGTDRWMKQRSVRCCRGLRIDDRRQRPVLDRDAFEGVFG